MAENTELPFNQIEKPEISLVNSNTSLFIIGNGFDLMHDVPSSYYNFRDFLGRNNSLRNALENYIKRDDLWADFEESLAHLDDDAMLGTTNDMVDIYDVKPQFEEEIDLHKSKSKDLKIKNQTAYDLSETARYGLAGYYDATTKKSADVINDNKDKFKNFRHIEDVVVIGHSLSQVDYPYFKEIIKYNQNSAAMNWHISWYSSGDLKRIKQFVSEMNISNSKVKIFRT